MSAIIQVKGLTKHFGNLTAVRDLDFCVQEGEVYGFLGQNGAGKSTTLRMLLTLVQPSHGHIEMFGTSLRSHRKEILRRVGAIIEKPDLYQYLPAYDNLRLFAGMSGIRLSRHQLMQQLELVGLADRAQDKVAAFSQGMKQRLGVAVALVHDPALIILDEPTNGLDPQGIADIRNLVLHLSRAMKKTILISSHLLSEMEQLATRLLIIDAGRKLVEGSAAELFDPAQTIVELQTLDNHSALAQLQQSIWADNLRPQRDAALLLQLNRSQVPQLHVYLVQAGIPVVSLQPRHSLEDYFLRVTSGKQHVDTYAN